MRITVWDPSRKVNHLSEVICDRKIITEFTRLISSTRIGKPVLMMDIKVSKDKNISRWVDRGNLIYVRETISSTLDEIESKTVHKAEKVIDRSKRSKTISEVKPVENISKNLQSFLEISLVQEEVLLSHKLFPDILFSQDHKSNTAMHHFRIKKTNQWIKFLAKAKRIFFRNIWAFFQ